MPFEPSALLKELDGDQLEALVDTMVLAADADGELSDDEVTSLANSIAALAKGTEHEGALAGEALGARIDEVQATVAGGERAALIESVKTRLPDSDARTAALGLAIVVTAADGIVRTSERELIMDLADAFAIDRDVAADLVRDITRG
jgi:tellurite resistance protein